MGSDSIASRLGCSGRMTNEAQRHGGTGFSVRLRFPGYPQHAAQAMQIVCVTHNYPRYDGDVAGAFVERLVLALRDRSHSVKVIAAAEKGKSQRERRHGISVSRVRYAPAMWETLGYGGALDDTQSMAARVAAAAGLAVAQAREIGHLHGVQTADIVHAHWWVPGGVAAWMARLTGKPRYVVTLHGSDVRLLQGSWFGRTMARRVLRKASAVTAVSSYLAEQVARFAGIDAANIAVQPMPIDVERFTTVSHGGGGIVSVGRLTRQKNFGVVLEAVARLRQQGRSVPLTVVGDGPDRDHLAMRAKGLGIEELVQFTGVVPPEKMPEIIGRADVMVFPAEQEGLGLVAAEALLMGVPVVAARSGGGVTDIVPPTGAGRLVPATDAIAVAVAIAAFLDDPASRRLAIDAGASLRRRLDPPAVAESFETIYRNAMGARSR